MLGHKISKEVASARVNYMQRLVRKHYGKQQYGRVMGFRKLTGLRGVSAETSVIALEVVDKYKWDITKSVQYVISLVYQ